MSQPRRHAVLAYDIPCNRRRGRVLRVVEPWRIDGQKSVHECLLTPAEADALLAKVRAMVEPAEDCVLLLWSDRQRPIQRIGGQADTEIKIWA